jgi:hypothetical protein
MSRGPGSIQSLVLEATLHEPVSVEMLRWGLAEEHGAVSDDGARPFPIGMIRKGFDQSFSRAVRLLVEGGRLCRQDRRLGTLDEMVRFYPYKSRSLEMRRLREALLPCLAAHLSKLGARYSVEDNEEWLPVRSDSHEWNQWDLELLRLEIEVAPDLRHELFDLRVKLKELLGPGRVTSAGSLLGMIRRAKRKTAGEPSSTFAGLEDAYWRWFPRDVLKHAKLKGLIHHAVDLSHGRAGSLHKRAKEWLLEDHRDLLESMPGHRPARTRKKPWSLLPRDPIDEIEFDPLLDRLVSRDVYRPFGFLTRG